MEHNEEKKDEEMEGNWQINCHVFKEIIRHDWYNVK